jgi:LysM repeat protein
MRPIRGFRVVPGFLLLLAFASAVLVGCSRPAAVRESEATEGLEATEFVQMPTGLENRTPEPGETVVSVGSPIAVAEATVSFPTAEPTTEPTVEPSPAAAAAPTEAIASPVPEPTAVSVSVEGEETIVHRVKKGETLFAIAERYGTTPKAIARLNDLADASTIYPGQKLRISGTATSNGQENQSSSACRVRHKVKKGEWVWKIAREYDVSPYEILAANDLTVKQANTIQPGLVLCIP